MYPAAGFAIAGKADAESGSSHRNPSEVAGTGFSQMVRSASSAARKACGGRMPAGQVEHATDAQLAGLHGWIAAGAPREGDEATAAAK